MRMLDSRSFPIVDYCKHPAYSSFKLQAYDEAKIANLLHKIDNGVAAAKQREFNTKKQLLQFYKITIQPLFNEIIEEVRLHADHEVMGLVTESIESAKKDLLAHLILANNRHNYKPKNLSVRSQNLFDSLEQDGIAFCTLEQNVIKKFFDMTVKERQALEKQHKPYQLAPKVHAYTYHHPVFREVMKELIKAGVIDAISNYKGKRQDPLYVALSLSDENEDWWEGGYSEFDLPTAKTSYMHTDRDQDLIKAIIYLDNVAPENGPFSYIPGSHKWARSISQMAIIKAIEDRLITQYRQQNTSHRRSAFKSESGRKVFRALPKIFQAVSHFGEDVVDDSELSSFLLNNEKMVLSEHTNCFIFEGAHLIHRGGMVEQGKRWGFQLAFGLSVSDQLDAPWWKRTLKAIRRHIPLF
jgi:hypothetical protein